MREKLKTLWQAWHEPITIVVMCCLLAWQAGYWFTKGAQSAGGMVVINVTYQE
jgi:hypothetical protein